MRIKGNLALDPEGIAVLLPYTKPSETLNLGKCLIYWWSVQGLNL